MRSVVIKTGDSQAKTHQRDEYEINQDKKAASMALA
jgi:hypothetical protein